MTALMTTLGIAHPVLAAPMAGGPSTAELIVEAAKSGSLGFVAAGYRGVDALAEQIAAVRAGGAPFGVNLFAPSPVPVAIEAFQDYARLLQPEADTYGIDLSAIGLLEDNDHWNDKIALLLADPVELVSFTFAVPSAEVIASLKAVGTLTMQTVTSADEAQQAADAQVDVLVVQSSAAGGHSGTFTPNVIPHAMPLPELIRDVRARVTLPIVGAGGIGTADDVVAAMAAGAGAVLVGTALLRADESGASAPHKQALGDPAFDSTTVTRAFSGRPARALRNRFTDTYTQVAPSGYPAIHHLTSPLRKAAAAAGDIQRIHLWAGTGFASAIEGPTGHIMRRLCARL